MIHTYLASITPLLDEVLYLEYYKESPQWRKDKADRMKFQLQKAQSVGVWALLLQAKKRLGVGEGSVYNLSHSGNYVLCALSDQIDMNVQVGCDVEVTGELPMNIAKRFYTQREYEFIRQAQSEEAQRQLFFRFWVLKESFLKATRQGIKLDTRSFEIDVSGEGNPILVKQPEEFPEAYYYKEYVETGIEAKIAICTTEKDIAHNLTIFTLGK